MSTKDKAKDEIEVEATKSEQYLEYHKLSLPPDYYAITWASLRKTQFLGATMHGVDVYLTASDHFWIYINFITFTFLLMVSILILVKEALIDDVFTKADWIMVCLRVILVSLAQRKLLPEFSYGYYKMLYGLKNRREFTHPEFAIFIGFCQMLVTISTLIAVLFFVCMADEYIDPVTNFGGVCVLSELDDWVGDVIMSNKLKGCETLETEEREQLYQGVDDEKNPIKEVTIDKENEKYDLTDLNSRIPLINKLALITEDDLEIKIEESLVLDAHWFIVLSEKVIKVIPWKYLIPLATIPISYYLPKFTKFLRGISF